MNDPRLLNDPDMAGALEPIKEIHAIRLKLQDETAGMTPEEVADFYNKKAEAFLAPMGKSLCYDRVGMGRLLSNPIRGSGRPGDTQSVSLGLERRGA